MVHGSVVHELVRKTGQISVHVISADDSEAVPPKSVQSRPKIEPIRIEPYLGSAVAVAVALGVGELLSRVIDVHNVSLAFLMAVLVSAVAWACCRRFSPASSAFSLTISFSWSHATP